MTKKRWVAAAAIMSMVLTVPIGCQGTSAGSENPSMGSKDSSQEDLVVPKNQESTVSVQTAKGGNIAEQVQAPDAFELQFSDESGKIEVEVKARVVVPEADGFRLKPLPAGYLPRRITMRSTGCFCRAESSGTGWLMKTIRLMALPNRR